MGQLCLFLGLLLVAAPHRTHFFFSREKLQLGVKACEKSKFTFKAPTKPIGEFVDKQIGVKARTKHRGTGKLNDIYL